VRDGIEAARIGLPAVALVTAVFWPQGSYVARAAGMPDIPRLKLPHPVSGSGEENMRKVAAMIAPDVLRLLRGEA